jgi:hypothetical protein
LLAMLPFCTRMIRRSIRRPGSNFAAKALTVMHRIRIPDKTLQVRLVAPISGS